MDTEVRSPVPGLFKILEEEKETEDNNKTEGRRLAGWLYDTAGFMRRFSRLRKDHVLNTRIWFHGILSSYFKIQRSRGRNNNNTGSTAGIGDEISIEIPINGTKLFLEFPSPGTAVFREEGGSLAEHSGADQEIIPTREINTSPDRSVATLLNERFYNKENERNKKEMTALHYADKKQRQSCKSCGEKFSYRRRARHCGRCGGVFCSSCVQFQRRLNELSQLDADGRYKKVCQRCYKVDVQELGSVRRLTEEFQNERKILKCERIVNQRVNSKTQTFWRDQIDVEAECRRLLDGFERYVGQSEPYKAVQDFQGYITVPYWQRSKFWQAENTTRTCRQCRKEFGFRKPRRNCKVCSLALCKQCSNKELLIYYDDNVQRGHRSAHIALINVDGCPSTEPDLSLLLHVCSDCKVFIQEKQEDNHCWYECLRDDSPLAEINRMNKLFEHLTSQIRTDLQKEVEKCHNASNSKLAQLSMHLDEYYTLYKSLENLLERAESKQQHLFIKNYTKVFLDNGSNTFKNNRGLTKAKVCTKINADYDDTGKMIKPALFVPKTVEPKLCKDKKQNKIY